MVKILQYTTVKLSSQTLINNHASTNNGCDEAMRGSETFAFVQLKDINDQSKISKGKLASDWLNILNSNK